MSAESHALTDAEREPDCGFYLTSCEAMEADVWCSRCMAKRLRDAERVAIQWSRDNEDAQYVAQSAGLVAALLEANLTNHDRTFARLAAVEAERDSWKSKAERRLRFLRVVNRRRHAAEAEAFMLHDRYQNLLFDSTVTESHSQKAVNAASAWLATHCLDCNALRIDCGHKSPALNDGPAVMTPVPNKPKTPLHSFRCPDDDWKAAQVKAEERGENWSEELRKFVRRYARSRR